MVELTEQQKALIREASKNIGGSFFLMDTETKLAVAEGRATYSEYMNVPIITQIPQNS